jgi:hypothetical protein
MSLNLKQLMEDDAGRPVPPAPVDDMLAGGRSRVRRRRIVAVAAAAVAAVLAIAIPVGLLPGDSTDEPIGRLRDSLTFTRADGTLFTVVGARALCRPPSETETDGQLIEVWGGLPQDPGPGDLPTDPTFMLEVPVDAVADGATMTFPDDVTEHTGYSSAPFSAYDAAEDNELSSTAEGASGTITFASASCDPNPGIDATIDATLASERGGPPVRVQGRLTLGS